MKARGVHDNRIIAAIRAAVALCALLLGLFAVPAAAATPPDCHAISPPGPPLAPAAIETLTYVCEPITEEFRDRWLWTRLVPPDKTHEYNLVVRPTRVDRVRVVAVYADGSSDTQEIRAGDYGDHWSMDNRVTFDLPGHDAPLRAVYVGAEHLRFTSTLLPRLIESAEARYTATAGALTIGASIALLLASFVYNCFRLIAQRQTALLGHVLWALFMLIWALLFSQVILAIFPGLAGTWSSRLGTLTATAAVTSAAGLFATAVEPAYLRRRARCAILAVGFLPVTVAALTLFELGSKTSLMTPLINLSATAPVLVVSMTACVTAWQGSRVSREFLIAWVLPMAAVLASSAANFSIMPGTTGQMSVLIASALQTILLSMTMTMNVATVRAERDRERKLGAEYRHMALTDPLTGLSNRRGFVAAVERMIAGRERPGLILLDLDHFKAINDSYGHLTGDEALAHVGRTLVMLCPPGGIAGRLGGEEFGVAVPGFTANALAAEAEAIRAAIYAIDMGDALGGRRLTCSLGVADLATAERPNFDGLFSTADRALYDAKDCGRDRVVVARKAARVVA